jgi:hypothetical protein
MLYCLSDEKPYNLSYYMAKRMGNIRSRSDKLMPYGMLLTRLFRWVMKNFPHLQNFEYPLVNPVMKPLGGQQHRTKQRSDKGAKRARKSTSDATFSSSSLHHGSSSQPLMRMMLN